MIRLSALLALVVALPLSAAAQSETEPTKLLRFPDIHEDNVVFSYGGDLWTAPVAGGTAVRLTSHPGLELFPKFSPDGRHIAFTGQYDGDEQVYVIPAGGGESTQLTYYPAEGPLPPRWGYDNQVYGWTPDGEKVLFRSLRDGYGLTDSKLYTVSPDGGLPAALPMPVSGAGDLSPDGNRVVYSPLFRDFRTWKRYEGGWAQDLYIFDLDSYETVQVTDHPRTDRDPMWVGASIYFASDRSDYLNLYRYDPGTGETTPLTDYEGADVRWPSDDGQGRIVFELDGTLHVYDLDADAVSDIAITVPDDAAASRPETIKVADKIEDFHLSPSAKRAVFTARGDIFTVPAEAGVTRNLTRTPGAHEREAAWSPKGGRIAFVSDATGEEELYLTPHDGRGDTVQLTKGSKTRYYDLAWAPDGVHLACSDAEGVIAVIDTESRSVQRIANDPGWPMRDYAWSPDSRWLAYSLAEPNGFRSLHVWDAETGESRRITKPTFHEEQPSFSPDGQHLFYLSTREFAPQIAQYEWNYALDRGTGIFALALTPDAPNPFLPKNDEAVVTPNEDAKEEAEGAEEKNGDDGKRAPAVAIAFDGLTDRVIRVPVEADNYRAIHALEGKLLYGKSGPFYYGRQSDVENSLHVFDFEKRESSPVAEKIMRAAISPDGSAVMVQSGGSYKIQPIGKPASDAKNVDTGNLELRRDPQAEWAAIFDEVWRRFRDYFYVANMHGYDWQALKDKYRPLVAHVAHRTDLNYVLGEMIAELNVSHAYVGNGDIGLPERPKIALLGARLELDADSGRYRIARIFRGDNAEEKYRSPLAATGLGVSEDDYLLAIDGAPLTAEINPYALLAGAADETVEILVSETPDMADARAVLVEPTDSEDKLIYLDWVEKNRARVAEATGGRAGYLHIPDMGPDGIYEFIKWFYGQVRKDGLVVDVRGNGGGNVSQMLIERLARDLIFTSYARTLETIGTYPNTVFTGPMVGLLDEDSASDGDIFPAAFKELDLGPLIGKRSWGGVIGITSHGPLLDGGNVFVPQFGFADAKGDWILEGTGVEPDIVVENDPKALIEGRDPQLERAIEELKVAMETEPAALPERPAPPVKTPE